MFHLASYLVYMLTFTAWLILNQGLLWNLLWFFHLKIVRIVTKSNVQIRKCKSRKNSSDYKNMKFSHYHLENQYTTNNRKMPLHLINQCILLTIGVFNWFLICGNIWFMFCLRAETQDWISSTIFVLGTCMKFVLHQLCIRILSQPIYYLMQSLILIFQTVDWQAIFQMQSRWF